MGSQRSDSWKGTSGMQNQEQLHNQLLSEQLTLLQAAQNVISQGRSPKQPREPGGGVTAAQRQEPPRDQAATATRGHNMAQDLKDGEETEEIILIHITCPGARTLFV
jgi:hypothetical protein